MSYALKLNSEIRWNVPLEYPHTARITFLLSLGGDEQTVLPTLIAALVDSGTLLFSPKLQSVGFFVDVTHTVQGYYPALYMTKAP